MRSLSHGGCEQREAACPCFFNDTATTEIYTLSLHDALPILATISATQINQIVSTVPPLPSGRQALGRLQSLDRKSTRLNSSHANISYAVFCLKKPHLMSRFRAPHVSRLDPAQTRPPAERRAR